jgi:hypothetical protein
VLGYLDLKVTSFYLRNGYAQITGNGKVFRRTSGEVHVAK